MKLVKNLLKGALFVAISTYMMSCSNSNPVGTTDKKNEPLPSSSLDEQNIKLLKKEVEKMDTMTIDELNNYIDSLKNVCTKRSLSKTKAVLYTDAQLAWLAAAKVASNMGYPCAAKLVEYSVWNYPYTEVEDNYGLFTSKILKDADFLNYFREFKSSGRDLKSFIFTRGDLFYALHKVNAKTFVYNANYAVQLDDYYDFELDNRYLQNLFATTVNNWGWLSQQTGVLNNIKVYISFTTV